MAEDRQDNVVIDINAEDTCDAPGNVNELPPQYKATGYLKQQGTTSGVEFTLRD